MKKTFTLILFCLCFCLSIPAFSQYCMLSGEAPYASVQPGITNFQLNSINRTSGNVESFSTVVVSTGLSTTLTAGQTYTISITHSEDTQNFPGARNNLRVWIDYNNNFSYSDAGEKVLSKDLAVTSSAYTGTFTVPLMTPASTVSLRATAKMSIDAGHSLPSPCNVPADPLGYHGEMEDYTLVIEAAAPQAPTTNFVLTPSLCLVAAASTTNSSIGVPAPTYLWKANPSAGVTFSPNATAKNPQILFSTAGNYMIMCIASNSVSSDSTYKPVTVSDCNFVGLDGVKKLDQLQLGPNPVSGNLSIQLPSEEQKLSVSISDYLGKIVLEKRFGDAKKEITIDLSALDSGIYFVMLSSGQNLVTRQIIVNR